jgi:hypothetical protein
LTYIDNEFKDEKVQDTPADPGLAEKIVFSQFTYTDLEAIDSSSALPMAGADPIKGLPGIEE